MKNKPTRVCSSLTKMSRNNTLLRVVKIFNKGMEAVWFNTEQYSTTDTPIERLIFKAVADKARANIKKVGNEWVYCPSKRFFEEKSKN